MASFIFPKAKEKMADGDLDWTGSNQKLSFVDMADYTPAPSTDEFFDDIPSGAIISSSSNLSGKTSTLGVMDATDQTLTSVSGDQFEAIVFWQDSGSPSTSPLRWLIDNYTGLPATPNGGNILVQFPNTSAKIAAVAP